MDGRDLDNTGGRKVDSRGGIRARYERGGELTSLRSVKEDVFLSDEVGGGNEVLNGGYERFAVTRSYHIRLGLQMEPAATVRNRQHINRDKI